jgi:hypothetical protein
MKIFWEPSDLPLELENWCEENVFEACKQQIEESLLYFHCKEGKIDIRTTGFSYEREDGVEDVLNKSFSLEKEIIRWLKDYDGLRSLGKAQKEDMSARLKMWDSIDRAVRHKIEEVLSMPDWETKK